MMNMKGDFYEYKEISCHRFVSSLCW